MALWMYYYKDNACKAGKATDADCICWHSEGDGPLPDERRPDTDEDTNLTWRRKRLSQSLGGG